MASDAILACFAILAVAAVSWVHGFRRGATAACEDIGEHMDRLGLATGPDDERDIAGTGVAKRDG